MKNRGRYLSLVAIALFLAMGSQAHANDKIVSNVFPLSGPTPITENEGASSGVIRLIYPWNTDTCTSGPFATFKLTLLDQAGKGQPGSYPSTLTLADSGGGTPVQLSPDTGTFPVTGTTWSGETTVTVNIACPTNFTDGSTLDGQLNESTPNGSHLDTITTVQVHIVFVSPTACLKLYSFETQQDSSTLLSSVDVVEKKSNSTAQTTNPGQISVDGLVANTCSGAEQFDLLVTLDQDWETNPSGNPGNATFTYFTTGEVDPTTFDLSAFGTGTKEGTNVCLTNVTLPGGESFLTTVHSEIISGTPISSLPSDNDFDFSVQLFQANSSCGQPIAAGIVGPTNPATSFVNYSVK